MSNLHVSSHQSSHVNNFNQTPTTYLQSANIPMFTNHHQNTPPPAGSVPFSMPGGVLPGYNEYYSHQPNGVTAYPNSNLVKGEQSLPYHPTEGGVPPFNSLGGYSTNQLPSTDTSSISRHSKAEKVARPHNSFILYRKDKAKEITRDNPNMNQKEVSKTIGKLWREESKEVKEHYARLSQIHKEEHRRKHPTYKYTPRKGRKQQQVQRKQKGLDSTLMVHPYGLLAGGTMESTPLPGGAVGGDPNLMSTTSPYPGMVNNSYHLNAYPPHLQALVGATAGYHRQFNGRSQSVCAIPMSNDSRSVHEDILARRRMSSNDLATALANSLPDRHATMSMSLSPDSSTYSQVMTSTQDHAANLVHPTSFMHYPPFSQVSNLYTTFPQSLADGVTPGDKRSDENLNEYMTNWTDSTAHGNSENEITVAHQIPHHRDSFDSQTSGVHKNNNSLSDTSTFDSTGMEHSSITSEPYNVPNTRSPHSDETSSGSPASSFPSSDNAGHLLTASSDVSSQEIYALHQYSTAGYPAANTMVPQAYTYS
ncbi:hypothetical protein IWQ61_002288 [Dispira simplex]|nr:hypothetical protein IWQ61_002288 [Dispira simplex]